MREIGGRRGGRLPSTLSQMLSRHTRTTGPASLTFCLRFASTSINAHHATEYVFHIDAINIITSMYIQFILLRLFIRDITISCFSAPACPARPWHWPCQPPRCTEEKQEKAIFVFLTCDVALKTFFVSFLRSLFSIPYLFRDFQSWFLIGRVVFGLMSYPLSALPHQVFSHWYIISFECFLCFVG